jgi:hypothetical protein
MGGGLLQLVAYGAQDAYISGNPQITFWKGLFKRHTNFAMEPFRINFSGQPSWGTKQTAIIGRHADLLYSTYVEVVLPFKGTNDGEYAWSSGDLGYKLIRHVELDIGGQIVDRMYSEFMVIWAQLTLSSDARIKLSAMVDPTIRNDSECADDGRKQLANVLYIPLPFFFTRNPGAALPLIALQYHEVKINVLWNDPQFFAGDFRYVSNCPPATQAALYIDYIYLDTEERRRMAQASHEYLIEQTQFNEDKGIRGANNRIDLTFNHPVKELIWVVQPAYYTDCKLAAKLNQTRLTPFFYDSSLVYEQWIQINGQDRLDRRYGDYYSKVQPFQHHTGTGSIINPATGTINYGGGGLYCYSFALRPEEHQPSGTCNFSRIDTATIVMNMAGGVSPGIGPSTSDAGDWNVRVYAVNYNVLRVMSGMGGLAYSN